MNESPLPAPSPLLVVFVDSACSLCKIVLIIGLLRTSIASRCGFVLFEFSWLSVGHYFSDTNSALLIQPLCYSLPCRC